MARLHWITIIALTLVVAMPAASQAQPIRQMPGTRPFLPGNPRLQDPNPNTRVRAAASATGLESTDFYPKNGYPKVLGDAVESGSASGGSSSSGGASGIAGNNGNTGVQSSGSMGFQGNSGNQIGNSGSTVLGQLFGANVPPGGGGGLNVGNQQGGTGLTGGGFSGMVPKGFGFGGTPELHRTWTSPLSGASGK